MKLHIRVYLTGLSIRFICTDKPVRLPVKFTLQVNWSVYFAQLCRYDLHAAQVYLTGLTEQVNLSGRHYRV